MTEKLDPTMATASHCWMNGKLVEWENATVHLRTHALHYGSSIFEGIRGYGTDDGNVNVFRLKDHMIRMEQGAKVYRMTLPYTVDQFCDAVKETVRACNIHETCYIRPIIYRGDEAFGL